MAAAVAALYPGAARAVLFYGSCLRQRELDGLMLDFYLIVSDYRAAYGRSWRAPANRLIPPNVFPFEHDGLVAKYAVLSEADFDALNGPETLVSVSVWARFAQPSRLVWSADEAARGAAVEAVARAAPTLLGEARPTVGTERRPARPVALRLRPDLSAPSCGPSGRAGAGSVVEADPERYRRFTAPGAGRGRARPGRRRWPSAERRRPRRRWAARRRAGKALTVLRLLKASGTYAGGIDYLAWKINRHAGTKIEVKPWQRRWPLRRGYRPAAAAAEAGGHSLGAAGEGAGDGVGQAATVNGLRKISWPLSSLGIAGLADIAGDEEDGDRRPAGGGGSRTSSGPVISGIMMSVMISSMPALLALEHLERLAAAGAGDRAIAELLERADGRAADPRIVLDDEDRGAGRRPGAASSAGGGRAPRRPRPASVERGR